MSEALSRRSSLLVVLVVLGWLLGYTMMPVGVSPPNERSRLYLTVAMVEHQSFSIDRPRARFGRIYDEARYAGHHFTDKAPGASLLAVPSYALYRMLVDDEAITVRELLMVGRYGVMLPLSIVGFLALRRLATALGLRQKTADFVACVSLVATPAFHYAAAFFGHHIVAVLWTVAAVLLLTARQRRGMNTCWLHGLFGLAVGLAQLTEYQAVLGTVVLLGLWLVAFRSTIGAALPWLLLGTAPCVLFLAIYNVSCFGGPFEIAYEHLANPALAAIHSQGVGGVVSPSLPRLWGSLFSLHRGLFATAPWLAFFPLGILALWRRGCGEWAVAFAALIGAYVAFMASSLTWEAGWGYGPRLLLPIVPSLALLIGFALERFAQRQWFLGGLISSLLWSLANVQMVTAFFPEPPVEFRNPLVDVVWVLARAETFLPHADLGLRGVWSFLPLAVLLLWPVGVTYRAAVALNPGRGWLMWVPLVPMGFILTACLNGPSVDARAQAEFVRFTRSLGGTDVGVRRPAGPGAPPKR